MLGTATITYDLADMLGVDFDARRTKVWVTTNVPTETVVDTDANKIRLGSGNGTIADDGTGSVDVWTPGTGSNPASWQTYVHVAYPDRNTPRGRAQRTFGPFTITAPADLADLVEQQEMPPEYIVTVTSALSPLVGSAQAAATTASASATSAAASAAAAATITGLTGEDDAVTFLVNDPASDLKAALSTKFDPRSRYDVRLSGVTGNGTTDDTAAAQAAATYCLANNLIFWLPAGLTGMKLTDTLTLRYMDVLLESTVTIAQNTKVGIVWGGTSVTTALRTIQFSRIVNSTTSPAFPSLRVVGVKNTSSTFGACDYIQFFADGGADTTQSSNAYGKYDLSGAIINKIEFLGQNGVGWNNDNKFFGGRLKGVVFTGTYGHNGNKFYGSTIEDGTIDFQVGTNNMFMDVRCEGTVNVALSAVTSHNLIVDSFSSNPAVLAPTVVVTDLGRENIVSTSSHARLRPVELMRLDRFSRVFNTASEYPCTAPPVPGLRALTVRTANSAMYDSGILPIEQSPETVSSVMEVTSRVTRFTFTSSHRVWRPQVYCYDANMVMLNSASGGPYIDSIGGWIASAGGYTKSASNTGTARICILDPAVKYVRIVVPSASAAGTVFDWVSLVGYVQEPHIDSMTNLWKRATARPLYQAAAPTQGIAHLGENIGHATGRFTCVARVDTTLTAAAAAAATTITVASIVGISSGDLIGVLLTDGTTHWTTVNGAPAGSTVTLTTALPSAAASGLQVSTNRWVSVV